MTPSSQRRPKLVFVAHYSWVLYNFKLPLAAVLRDAGAEVVFICPNGEYTPQLLAAGYRVVDWKLNRSSLNPFTELIAFFDLLRCYRAEKPDLLLHFTIKANLYGSLAVVLLRARNLFRRKSKAPLPAVVNHFTGLGFVLSSSSFLGRLLRLMLLPIMRVTFRLSKARFLFQNEADLATFIRERLADEKCSGMIPTNGVNVNVFRPAKSSLERPVPVVLFAGRVLWEKGIREFVEAAQLVAREVRAEFWVAELPDAANPDAVPLSTIERWEQEGPVRFIGMHDDMPALLRTVDVAALPSYHEGLSRFLIEAAACGLPLIATDIPGCREIVHDGRNGFLVPVRDKVALAEALRKLLHSPDLRRRFAEESRRIVMETYSSDLMIPRYCKFYSEAVGCNLLPDRPLATTAAIS